MLALPIIQSLLRANQALAWMTFPAKDFATCEHSGPSLIPGAGTGNGAPEHLVV